MLDEFMILVEEVFEKRFFDMPASQIIGGTVIFIVFWRFAEFCEHYFVRLKDHR